MVAFALCDSYRELEIVVPELVVESSVDVMEAMLKDVEVLSEDDHALA